MQLYPAHASEALEFEKIRMLLLQQCRMDEAKSRVTSMQFHTRIQVIRLALEQTEEYRQLLSGGDHFPNDFTRNIKKEIQLLALPGAAFSGDQLLAIQHLVLNIKDILRWFDRHSGLYQQLRVMADKTVYEKQVVATIGVVIDEIGQVRDTASKELLHLRTSLVRTRQEQRKVFEGVLRKLQRQGYLADISEGFLNGRRTVAVAAEYKRIVRGILHGESDTRQTVFIEPEETIALNNDVASLERAEIKEINRILAATTAALAPYQPLLAQYYRLCGIYDFIRAKALLANAMQARMPRMSPHPVLHLIHARHPLLWLHHRQTGKAVIPLDLSLDAKNRLLIISGPNAGGKTVAMKTAGLLQLMIQSGLLIPADPSSEVGVFRQLMIHIGDTQSIEQELSTYSAHLRDMKHFMAFVDGKTLFFIDELGSGSDPGLGGAFAEAIIEELAGKQAKGIVTTHYLNLKIMAESVPGIFNGAMEFDEEKLEPRYRLVTGKPGSSYTFAVAKRTGIPDKVIARAKQLTEKGHFKLDTLLHQAAQQIRRLAEKEKSLNRLLKEHEALKQQYEILIDKERLKQQQDMLKLQNQIKKEELEYLRDMERKFRQIIHDWKKTEHKETVILAAEKVLFRKKQVQHNQAAARKADRQYEATGLPPQEGDLVRNKATHQIGLVRDIRTRHAIVQIGRMPFRIQLEEWIAVRKKTDAAADTEKP